MGLNYSDETALNRSAGGRSKVKCSLTFMAVVELTVSCSVRPCLD